MLSYQHPNSSTLPPTLDEGRMLPLYRAVIAGEPVTLPLGHFLPDDLRLLAERLDCDAVARHLTNAGVTARVVSHDGDGYAYHEAAVTVYDDGLPRCTVDAEAARRIEQRVAAGLPLMEAITRTLAQCAQPVLSAHALRELEAEADAHVRRVEQADRLRERRGQ